MKALKFIAVSILSASLLTACNSETSNKMEAEADTLGNNIEAAVENVGDNMGDNDTTFVRDAVKMNKMELAMLELGTKMGTDAELKKHAKMMIADHEKLGNKVAAFATKAGIRLDDIATEELKPMDEPKGSKWDEEWLEDMKDAHKKTISEFEDAQDDVKDAELKGIIAEALPTLRAHLDMVTKMEEAKDKANDKK